MKINRLDVRYPSLLATYMNTNEGKSFMLEIASQLIDSFEIDHKNRIKNVVIDDKANIQLNME